MNESAKKHKIKSLWPRKIIHIDMDAFYAAVEQRDRPGLRGKPVVVGGSPQSRGVVSTASYEARKFGIHSAMPAAQAKRLCPDAVFLKPRFDRYREISATVMSILNQHTSLVEPVSLDEAYLDVSQHRVGLDDPVLIAKTIKQSIWAVTKLTASAGVASNLFLAKVASDINKPDGLTVIYPHEIQKFLKNLPVRKIPGVGPVTEKSLHCLDLYTCSDLERAGIHFLKEKFGKTGIMLYERAIGIDRRQVEADAESKQYSAEETFEKDTRNLSWLESKLKGYAEEIYQSLHEQGRSGKTIVLKVKYHDFELITRSKTLKEMPSSAGEIYQVARELLVRKTLAGKKAVRLLGLGVSGLQSRIKIVNSQRELFPNSQ